MPDAATAPARRADTVEVLHGIPVADPYRWLEDPASPETVHWGAAQDRLWRTVRDTLPNLGWWHDRLADYIDVDFTSAPVWRGGTRFVMRHVRGTDRPELWAIGPDGRTRNLLDLPAGLGSGVQAWQPSPDGSRLAFTLTAGGSEDANLHVMDVDTGRLIDGPIAGCGHTSIAWLPGGQALYHVRSETAVANGTPALAGRRVYLHRIGTGTDADEVVFGRDADGPLFYSVSVRADGRWLAMSASDGSPASGNDLWLADLGLAAPGRPRFVRVQRRADGNSGITFGPDGLLYILTNRDAPNRRIMVADPEHPDQTCWRPLVAADRDAVLTDFAILDGPGGDLCRLLVAWSRDAVSEVTVHDLESGTRLDSVPLPGAGKVGPLVTRAGAGDRAWFSYTDCTTSPRVVEYDAATATTSVSDPPRCATAPEVRTRRLCATSPDGTQVPMIVVHPASATGPVPTIMCGYGGFGITQAPTYSAMALAWASAGGCYVLAGVRGGGERGEAWHAAGRRHLRQNGIDDFIACAEHLVELGCTSPGQMAIWGGSNGALLVSSALTQRPDLFGAAICSAPLCDMVRYERSGLGSVWRSEYGSVALAEDFQHLLAYSPYHSVVVGRDYPATLFTASEDDERVDPLHARKMCAALQHATCGARPVVLRRERQIGHDGRSLARVVELTGDGLAFVAAHTGLIRVPRLETH